MPTHHRLYYLVKALRERRQKKLMDYTGVEERSNAEGCTGYSTGTHVVSIKY
jgi:hypothetical protein